MLLEIRLAFGIAPLYRVAAHRGAPDAVLKHLTALLRPAVSRVSGGEEDHGGDEGEQDQRHRGGQNISYRSLFHGAAPLSLCRS
ncbi:hypothetical protein SDC9_208250 [bioreactor metagenome]|uniref:Uncharacterized protein n=1 Tax=bioreactor metagenome TaxID=1076179 RepID=A0A645JBJ5_9ZZZZ